MGRGVDFLQHCEHLAIVFTSANKSNRNILCERLEGCSVQERAPSSSTTDLRHMCLNLVRFDLTEQVMKDHSVNGVLQVPQFLSTLPRRGRIRSQARKPEFSLPLSFRTSTSTRFSNGIWIFGGQSAAQRRKLENVRALLLKCGSQAFRQSALPRCFSQLPTL